MVHSLCKSIQTVLSVHVLYLRHAFHQHLTGNSPWIPLNDRLAASCVTGGSPGHCTTGLCTTWPEGAATPVISPPLLRTGRSWLSLITSGQGDLMSVTEHPVCWSQKGKTDHTVHSLLRGLTQLQTRPWKNLNTQNGNLLNTSPLILR